MKAYEYLPTTSSATNVAPQEAQLLDMQLSYSTAEIERTIFFAPEFTDPSSPSPSGKVKLLVVHGNYHTLEEDLLPDGAIPLTPESGLFRIVDLSEAA